MNTQKAYAINWLTNGTVSIGGFGFPTAYVASDARTDALRDALESVYDSAVQASGIPVDKPALGKRVRLGWLKAGLVRFYMGKQVPRFEADPSYETDGLREMLAETYARALPAKELTAMLSAEQDESDRAMIAEMMRS